MRAPHKQQHRTQQRRPHLGVPVGQDGSVHVGPPPGPRGARGSRGGEGRTVAREAGRATRMSPTSWRCSRWHPLMGQRCAKRPTHGQDLGGCPLARPPEASSTPLCSVVGLLWCDGRCCTHWGILTFGARKASRSKGF